MASLPNRMSMVSYRYSPLPKGRHFRLLRIVRKTADLRTSTASSAITLATEPELSVNLKTFPLDEAPPYWALSYTWGSPRCGPNGEELDPALQASAMIECGGAPMQIGGNLYDFLCLSRDRGLFISPAPTLSGSAITSAEPVANPTLPSGSMDWHEGQAAYLWADALCINQESLEERSQQVQLMGAIYELSGRVLVWLGRQPPPPETPWVFETFLPSLFALTGRKREALSRSTFEFEDGELADALGAETIARWRAAYPGLFVFLARSRWFGRGWTVQEVLLKDLSNVTMLCGTVTLRFDYFLGLMMLLFLGVRYGSIFMLQQKLSEFDQEGPGLWVKPPSPLDTLDTLRKVRRLIFADSSAQSITKWQRVLKLIANMGRSSFTDPRDRLFGCLGLIEAIVPRTDLDVILPDYTLSTTEILTTLACLLYENIYELEYMFSLAGSDPASTTSLPSWAPDFARLTERRALLPLGFRANSPTLFNASKLFPVPRCQAKVDGKALMINGAQLGVAAELVATQKPRWFSAEWLIEYCNQDESYSPTGGGRPEAVILTLSVDNANLRRRQGQRGHPGDAAGHVASTAREWYLRVLALMMRRGLVPEASLVTLTAAARRHPDWLPTAAEVLAAEGCIKNDGAALKVLRENAWDHQISTFIEERRLFLTGDGLLCLGPELVKGGDEVWIVRGSRVPILLRRAEDGHGYQLVGETYVHGVMYGEAMTEDFERQFTSIRLV